MPGRLKRTRAAKFDPSTRARFREVARDIIAKDRWARRHSLTQNTIGEIERALVRAYELGVAFTSATITESKQVTEGPLEWIRIPPRCRQTLTSMSICLSKRLGMGRSEPRQIECFTEDGRVRWAFVVDDAREIRSVSNGAASPLIGLGMIMAVDPDRSRYALTAAGIATCREYWRRSDANDPTLPRQSMR
jgi:hypothetical protein